MDCPGSSILPRGLPAPEQPDRLLTELHEAQIALAIAEQHIKVWRVDVATEQVPRHPRISFLAHEALDEAGKAIDRVAELLKIEANGTMATQQGHVAAGAR